MIVAVVVPVAVTNETVGKALSTFIVVSPIAAASKRNGEKPFTLELEACPKLVNGGRSFC